MEKFGPDYLGQAARWLQAEILTVEFLSQAAAILVAAGVALLLARWLRPPLTRRTVDWELGPTLQRLVQIVMGQIALLLFLTFLLILRAAARQMLPEDPPDRMISAVASLVAAWVVIRLTSALIANRAAAKVIALIAWTLAALDIVGLLTPVIGFLESIGLTLGSSRITLLDVIVATALLTAFLWLGSMAANLADQTMAGAGTMSPRARVLVGKILRGVLIALAVLISLSTVGINLAALAVFTGAVGVGIGIGLQHQVSNLMSGLFLLLDKSVKPGDVIEVGNTFGWVREMNARYVGVVTRDNKSLLIPNDSFILNQVTNWSHQERRVRQEVRFTVSFDCDPHRIRQFAVQAAALPERVSHAPPPLCHLFEFGEYGLVFVLRFWITDPEAGVVNIKGEVLLALWDIFRRNGIKIPYPRRVILPADDADPPAQMSTDMD